MRTNPYTDLKERANRFADKVFNRRIVLRSKIRREQLKTVYYASDLLYHHADAAQRLGYRLTLYANADGDLEFNYVENTPTFREW